MATGKVIARARVRLTIDLPVSDAWGDDCKVSQVHQQAKEAALGIIRNGEGLGRMIQTGEATVSSYEVRSILVEEQK